MPEPDFSQKIQQFIERIPLIKTKLSTEESTKNSLIMPVLNILGYNVFDPTEVNPEYTADFGVKTKEKVDYAIMKDGQPIMLIECKPCTMQLGNKQASQLYRYFSVCAAKIGLLTNGLEWMFFSDLEQENKMDKNPFLTINLEAMTDEGIAQLSKFQKDVFDTDNIISQGLRLKETSVLIEAMRKEMDQPSEELVRLFVKRVYDGVVNQKVIDKYTPMVKSAFSQVVADKLSVKVQALQSSIDDEIKDAGTEKPADSLIITTDEENLAFSIIRAICAKVCPVDKITMRDSQSYCAILFTDNNRKPVARLHFNSSTVKYISTFDKDGVETKRKIEGPQDIYGLQDQILEAVQRYL